GPAAVKARSSSSRPGPGSVPASCSMAASSGARRVSAASWATCPSNSTGHGVSAGGAAAPRSTRAGGGSPTRPGPAGPAVASAARARVAGNPQAVLVKAAAGDPQGITAPLVFRAAADGDALAASIVDEACQAMGAMIGIIVNGLNPEVVVITGGVAQSLAP